MTTLKLGCKGSDVKKLQELLHITVDGSFGPKTEQAVKEFQLKNNLIADGIVGTKTWYVLMNTNTRKIDSIILHCSATQEGKHYTVDDITRWHKERGFTTIGYHYVIYLNGGIYKGRDINIAGAHTTGHNATSIGICYIGGCDSKMNAKDTRTELQKISLVYLVKQLMKEYNISKDKIYCHNQFASKACPSFKIEDFKKEL